MFTDKIQVVKATVNGQTQTVRRMGGTFWESEDTHTQYTTDELCKAFDTISDEATGEQLHPTKAEE